MGTSKNSKSLCPVCLTRLSAAIVKREGNYYLEKNCPEHGAFSTVIWRGNAPSLEEWEKALPVPPSEAAPPDCPNACGLCAGHLRQTCCALVEVTSCCNLSCPVCFAQSGALSSPSPKEPSVKELSEIFRRLAEAGRAFVQLSGGEPTMRDDLPEIVAAARTAGCETVQLNSNGIRLGEDKPYARALVSAGLSFVFMQFDGTADAVYEKLRGRPLLDKKRAAIDVCSELGLGAALVPTLVPGVNDHNIGEILNFAIDNSPTVRGVHFQPVSYFGRCPAQPTDEFRITLPEILRAMEEQTGGKVKVSSFVPSACDHPRCGFHGDFVVFPNGALRSLTAEPSSCCAKDDGLAHIKNRNFVARRWKRPSGNTDAEQCRTPEDGFDAEHPDMDAFLERIQSHGFTITAMAFQDAWTIDLERLRRCSLHVYDGGRVIPFCARYTQRGL